MVKGSNGGQTISKRHVKPCGLLHTKYFFWLMFFGANVTYIRSDRRGERSDELSVVLLVCSIFF